MVTSRMCPIAVAMLLTGFLKAPCQSDVLLHFEGQTAGVVNSPYTARVKITIVQKLADGTTITRSEDIKEARDSQGRIMRERKPEGSRFDNPRNDQSVVMDTVNHTSIRWDAGSAQASLTHTNQRPSTVPLQSPANAGGANANTRPNAQRPPQPDVTLRQPEIAIERLEGRMIAGVYAEGTKITRTIPAGKEGNDRPITTVHETWTCPELQLTVLRSDDDPRTGLSTTETTELDRAEPDAALFRAPEGYTIKDENPPPSQGGVQ
jgi:hypothetical protein